MDITTFSTVVSAVYAPIKDAISYVLNNKGAISQGEYREQIREMINAVQIDISKLKGNIDDVKDKTFKLKLDTEERGLALWQTPRNRNCIDTWRYKRAAKKVHHFAEQFRLSMDGIIDVIACCSGIMEGKKSLEERKITKEPTWVSDLNRAYEDIMEKAVTPSKFSINELTNSLESFLDMARITL